MKTPHKHAELIKAWADGAEIQYSTGLSHLWHSADNPSWWKGYEYRIKPEPKPDVVETYWVESTSFKWDVERKHNLKLVFDGETGKLKAAEVL